MSKFTMPEEAARDAIPQSSVELHQQRGVGWDIVDEALESYRQFMLDDDYDYQRALFSIMERMQARRDLYRKTPVIADESEAK